MSQLHRDPVVREASLALHDVVLGLPPDDEPLRELEQDRPELAGRMQRHERVSEPLPHVIDQLRGHPLAIDVPLLEQVFGQRLSDVLVQRVHLRGVIRQQ